MLSGSLALLVLGALCSCASASCVRSSGEAPCAGHGNCDINNDCVCDPSGIWGDEFCDTALKAHIWPQIGTAEGGTDVAIVVYGLDLTNYLASAANIKVVLWQGFGSKCPTGAPLLMVCIAVFRYEIVCSAYGIKTPWQQPNPGNHLCDPHIM